MTGFREPFPIVYVDDVPAAIAFYEAADELQPPQLEPWGERRAYFRIPDGTLLHIAQPA